MSSPISSSSGPTARSPEFARDSFVGGQRVAPGPCPGALRWAIREGRMTGLAVGAGTWARASLPAAILAIALLAGYPAAAEDLNDYPTSARADYVFACMKANGE